jgi:molybdopterin molybdotransferase
MLDLDEARRRILDDLEPIGTETAPLLEATGRVVAEAILATRPSPLFDNSAMDGYAVHAADLTGASPEKPSRLPVVETISAGNTAKAALAPRHAMRIFTGAPIPDGADAVVMQEETRAGDGAVEILAAAAPGQHIRFAGEDLRAGDELVPAGAVVRPGDVGVLASQGRSWLRLVRRPRVAILPTGDELVEIDQVPGPGQVSNSNSAVLAAQVREAGGIPIRLAPAPDDAGALTRRLAEAAAGADLIVTSGGVSVGDFDLVRDVLGEQGAIDFWRVAIKPGKPLAYGRLYGRPLVGLPGNPVSTFVCFELFVRPALRRLAGHASLLRPSTTARLTRTTQRNRTRRHFLRGRLVRREGALWVEPASFQGSGHLSSMLGVEVLVDVAPGSGAASEGTEVTVLLLDPDAPALAG